MTRIRKTAPTVCRDCKATAVERRIYTSGLCGPCSAARQRAWRAANLEKARAIGRAHYERNRVKHDESCKVNTQKVRSQVLLAYGSKCACCQEDRREFLAIDHINGGGYQHRKALKLSSGSQFFYWLRREGFPPGFRVLCHNCNFSLGRYGYCPHGAIEATA